MSSLAAISGLPGETAYCASKAGLEAALESLRYELLPFGVHVSIIQPGYTADTGLVVSSRVPGMATGSVYEPLLVANDAGHDEVRETAESPDLVLDAIREVIASDEPAFRYPLGELGRDAAELRHLADDEVLAIISELFGLEEWMAQGSEEQS
jgi:NAD(P)-dependent dehydrogenase (short-subunit alcohol dehydrogenase family)